MYHVPEVVQATLEKIGIFQSHTLLVAHLETVHISIGAHLYIRNWYHHVHTENPSQALLAVPAYMYHRVFLGAAFSRCPTVPGQISAGMPAAA